VHNSATAQPSSAAGVQQQTYGNADLSAVSTNGGYQQLPAITQVSSQQQQLPSQQQQLGQYYYYDQPSQPAEASRGSLTSSTQQVAGVTNYGATILSGSNNEQAKQTHQPPQDLTASNQYYTPSYSDPYSVATAPASGLGQQQTSTYTGIASMHK
jgi:hypothetical protein